MRIDAFNKISQLYSASQVKKTNKTTRKNTKDTLELSQTGKDYHVVKQAVQNESDIRMDKVNAIKESIASGTYNVSMKEVADKLVDSYYDTTI